MTNIFGTDGIRAHLKQSILQPDQLKHLGYAIGAWITQQTNKGHILLGSDTRSSCNDIKKHLLEGMKSFPVHVTDTGIMPTPGVCKLVQDNETFSHGIIISASHNNADYNGIKIATKTQKLTKEDEIFISHAFNQKQYKASKQAITIIHQQLQNQYLEKIRQQSQGINLAGMTLVVDCAHGALSQLAPAFLKALNANVIAINNSPDGNNINKNSGVTAMQSLIQAVKKHDADIGVAFDGDGDRVSFVTKDGQIKDGDDIMWILHTQNSHVAGTIMTNEGLVQALKSDNTVTVRTNVGDKYIYQALVDHNAELGSEPSGHIILRSFCFCSDGLYTALSVLHKLQKTNNLAFTTFEKFAQKTENIKVKEKKDLNTPALQTIIKNTEKMIQPGRVIMRYSGTEPVLRVTAESHDQAILTKALDACCKEVKAALNYKG